MFMGRSEEALAHIQRAIELDPSNIQTQNMNAAMLVDLGRYDEALAVCRKVLAIVPNHPGSATQLPTIYHAKGMREEAIAAGRTEIAADIGEEAAETFVGAYDESGYEAAWKTMIKQIVLYSTDGKSEHAKRANLDESGTCRSEQGDSYCAVALTGQSLPILVGGRQRMSARHESTMHDSVSVGKGLLLFRLQRIEPLRPVTCFFHLEPHRTCQLERKKEHQSPSQGNSQIGPVGLVVIGHP